MLAVGAHLLVEAVGCARPVLDDVRALEALLRRAADAIGARVVTAAMHRFAPQGVTGFLLLEESHLSIHTWPERRYAALDLFTCGATDPETALPLLQAGLGAARLELVRVARGLPDKGGALRVVSKPR